MLDSRPLFLAITLPIAEPVPATTPNISELSNPNLILFSISLDGSVSLLGSSCVGPTLNASPNVPTDSGSPTKIASATPIPAAPPAVVNSLPPVVNASCIRPSMSGRDTLKYVPAFLESIALRASALPNFQPCDPGIPKLVNILAKLPTVVASAFSSKVVRSSKKLSTLAALLLPKPKSINDAPRVKAPFGISIIPAAIPDNKLCIVPTLSFDLSLIPPKLVMPVLPRLFDLLPAIPPRLKCSLNASSTPAFSTLPPSFNLNLSTAMSKGFLKTLPCTKTLLAKSKPSLIICSSTLS